MSFYAPFHINKTVIDSSAHDTIYFNCSTRSCRATCIIKKFNTQPNNYSILLKGVHTCESAELTNLPIEVCPPAIIEGIIKAEKTKRRLALISSPENPITIEDGEIEEVVLLDEHFQQPGQHTSRNNQAEENIRDQQDERNRNLLDLEHNIVGENSAISHQIISNEGENIGNDFQLESESSPDEMSSEDSISNNEMPTTSSNSRLIRENLNHIDERNIISEVRRRTRVDNRSRLREIFGSSDSESENEEIEIGRNRNQPSFNDNNSSQSRRGFSVRELRFYDCESTYVENELPGSIYCACCMEHYLPPYILLSCGHKICGSCFISYFTLNKTCHLCRTVQRLEGIQIIYLS